MAVLALRRRLDAAAQRVSHQLHPVADSEYRDAGIEERDVAPRRALVRDAPGPTGEDHADRPPLANLLDRRGRRPDFRVDRQLAQAARDELRVLRPEVENDDRLMIHEGSAPE